MKEITDWEDVPKDQITDWEDIPVSDEHAAEQNEPGFYNSLKRGGNRVAQSISAFDLATSLAYEQANKGLYKKTNNPRYLKEAEQNKTDAGQFFSDVVNTQKDIDSYPQHPDTQAAMKAAGEAGELVKKYGDPDKFLGNGALGQSLAAISELSNKFGESDNKTGIAADLVGEQIPNMAATILGSKGIGSLVKAAAPKLAGTLAAESAVVGGGSSIGSFASTYGTNVSDGIQKGMTPEAAANYGAKKSAIQSLTDGVAGAFVPIKFGSQVVNIPTQTAIQMIGGGGGEYLASIGVGEVPNLSDVVLEGVLEVIGLPGDMVSASLAKDGKAAPKPTNTPVIPDDPNAPTTTGTLEEMLTGTAAQSIAEKQAQPATTLATTNATTPTQEVLAPTVQPAQPSLQSDIQSGLVNSDSLKQMKQSGEIDFINGKWDYVNNSMDGQSTPSDAQAVADAVNQRKNIDPSVIREYIAQDKVRWNNGKLEVVEQVTPQAMPNDAQSVVDAVNSGGDIDRNTLVRMLKTGAVKWNNGKLEATPVTPEQQAAMQQLSQDVGKNFAQQQAVPLLEYSSTGVENVDTARDLRKESLANVIGQMIDSRDAYFNKNIDDTNIVPNRDVAYTKAVQDYHLRDKAVNDLKGQLLPNELPIASAYSDTDTVKATFDNIINRDLELLDIDVLHDLIDNGLAALNREGRPEMTDTGNRLYQELTNIGQTNDNQVTPETAPINDQNRDSIVSDEGAEVTGENPQSAVRAAKEQFDIKKNLVSSYLQNEQIGALAKDGIITDNDLDVMANLEMQSGGKSRDQYVSSLIDGKNPSKVLQKTGYQEPVAQPLPTPNTPKSTEPVWVEPTAPVKDTRNAFDKTLDNRKAEIGTHLAEGQTVDGVIAEAKRRLGEFAKKTKRVIDNNNVLPDLRLLGLQESFTNPAKGMKQLAQFIEDEHAITNERERLTAETGEKYSATQKKSIPILNRLFGKNNNDNKGVDTKVVDDSGKNYKKSGSVSSDAFKKWFGKSKVVDNDGQPLRVYHGTNYKFDKFQSNGGLRSHFFSSNPSVASTYAINTNPNVMPVYLSLSNPKIIDAKGRPFYNIDGNKLTSQHAALEAQNEGYDGLIVKNVIDDFTNSTNTTNRTSDVYIAFEPTQIKSASGNNGNYDATDPSIVNSTTPSPKFEANKDQLKTKITAIIRKINPSVNISLVDNLMGEGQALKDSGASSTDAQEVAGAYSRLKNLIYASMNTDKWNPEDTAYHEAFHSIFDMLSPTDKVILEKAFPGKGDITSEEQMAIEFARFMTEKNATGFRPAVRRIFLAMKEALRQIGRTLKLGKFESFEDVFNKIESGEVYKGRDAAREAVASANVAKLDKMLTDGEITQEQLQKAIMDLSPELYDVVYDDTVVSEEDEKLKVPDYQHNTYEGNPVATSIKGRTQPKDTPIDELDSNWEASSSYVDSVKDIISREFPETRGGSTFAAALEPTIKNIGKIGDIQIDSAVDRFGRQLTFKFSVDGRTVGGAKIDSGELEHLALDSKYRGRNFGEQFLKYLDANNLANIYEVPDRSSAFVSAQKKAISAIRNADIKSLDKLMTSGEVTPEQLKKAIKDISPELYDVVYDESPVSEEDEVAMADMVAESTGLPEDVLYSVTKRVFSKVAPDREKMLKSVVKAMSPVMTKAAIEKANEQVDANIKNTKREINSDPTKMNKYNLFIRNLVQSNDGSLAYVAAKYKSKAIDSVRNMFYHDAGTDKSIGATYFEAIDEYVNRNVNKIAKVVKGLSEKQLDQVTDMLQNPNKSFDATAKVRESAKVIAQIMKDQRAYLEAAGLPVVKEMEGYFPRIYDADGIMDNVEGFKAAARQAYSLTFSDSLHKDHAKLKDEVTRLTKKQQSYEKKLLSDPNYGNKETTSGTKYSALFERRATKLANIKRNYSESPDVYVGNIITEKVDRWLDNIQKAAQFGHSHDDDFNVLSDSPPQPDETKHRVLTKEADDIMRQFVMRNPVDVMSASIGRAARAAEFNRRLGRDKWTQIKADMQADGVDEEGLRQVMAAIRANTGMQNNVRGQMRDVLGAARYWSNLMFLPRAAFSSLSEGFTVATKTGNPADGLRNMYDGFRASLETKGSQGMRDASDEFGITGEIAVDMMMIQRTGGDYDSKARAYNNTQYFRRTGLTAVTAGQMSATTKSGQFFIGKLADQIANNRLRKVSSEFLVSEYGVPKDKIDEFAKWVTTNGGGKLSTEFGLDNSEMAGYYRTALRRFVNTTIQVPTAATRQRYASTPVGQFVYGLTSYINSFSKNVLIRNTRILNEAAFNIPSAIAQGVKATGNLAKFDAKAAKENISNIRAGYKDNVDKGYTGSDRIAMASQTMMLVPLMLLAAGVGELRDEIFSNPDAKEKSGMDHLMLGLSRGGAFGAFDPLVNMFTGLKYQRDPLNTFNGPAPAVAASLIKGAGNLFQNNSDNTNTAERNAAKLVYSTAFAPYLTSLIATNVPFGKVAYIGMQAVNAPQTKSAVADITAGKATKK